MPDPNARSTDLALLHPVFRELVRAVLSDLENERLPFRVFEAYRSPTRQQHLFDQGRTRPGPIITRARPWQSYHQYGVAADFVLFENGRWSWDDTGERRAWWQRLHAIGRQWGLEPLSWEQPHLQLAGLSWQALHAGQYPAGGDASWAENLESAIVAWRGTPPAPPVPDVLPARPPITSRDDDDEPLPASGVSPGWRRRGEGIEWRYDERGVYLRDAPDEPLRTPGEPVTCRAVWTSMGDAIRAAARTFHVPPALLVMTVATETGHLRAHGFTGPASFRWEPDVAVEDVQPPLAGDYRAGPYQLLATAARDLIRQRGMELEPYLTAPPLERQPADAPPGLPLYRPDVATPLAAAAIRSRWDETGDDPILVAAAYNAGGLRDGDNRWNLASTGNHLDRAAAWYGDACAVIAESTT
jgi:peptidoglycan LD-endopeptidase CwlK